MKIFLLFLFCGFFSVQAQFVYVTGKVVSSESNKALAYTNLMFQQYGMGTSTNEEGYFAFHIPDSLRDENLIFSHVGFQKKVVNISDIAKQKVVYLFEKKEFLNEVVLAPVRHKKQFTYRPESFYEAVGIGNLNADLYPSTIARYYEKPAKFNGVAFLEFVQIYFFPVKEQKDISARFRLHIYAVGKDGKPGEELLENMVLEKQPGQSTMKVELLEKKLSVPENGFFVGLEHLFIKQNEYRETKDYFINDSLVAENFEYKRYAPVYKGMFAEPGADFKVYYYGPQGWADVSTWEVARKDVQNAYVTPVFKIRITN